MTANPQTVDVWAALAAPLPADAIQWRQQGRPVSRDGRHIARFVAYIDSQFVQERFDSVVPGEWDSTLEPLPKDDTIQADGDLEPFAFKARIQVLGVIREDVGQGRDYKTAATDAFKRAAVRFGIARELYAYDQNWVQMDGDGKYAKPIEDPGVAYARRYGGSGTARPTIANSSPAPSAPASSPPAATEPLATQEESCPKCGGRMWDNRLTKRNAKAPDYKCRDRACGGVIWPPKPGMVTKTSGTQPDNEEEEDIPY